MIVVSQVDGVLLALVYVYFAVGNIDFDIVGYFLYQRREVGYLQPFASRFTLDSWIVGFVVLVEVYQLVLATFQNDFIFVCGNSHSLSETVVSISHCSEFAAEVQSQWNAGQVGVKFQCRVAYVDADPFILQEVGQIIGDVDFFCDGVDMWIEFASDFFDFHLILVVRSVRCDGDVQLHVDIVLVAHCEVAGCCKGEVARHLDDVFLCGQGQFLVVDDAIFAKIQVVYDDVAEGTLFGVLQSWDCDDVVFECAVLYALDDHVFWHSDLQVFDCTERKAQ